MNSLVYLYAMCCLYAVQARPSGHEQQEVKLVGVPDESGYSKLVYPKFDLLELGTVEHGHLPAKEIKVIRTIKISVPHPFPVKVPHKVPYPVHVVKPYPVHVTKLVQVPHPVPVEVVKNVPVPVEVPKPYPVSEHEYNSQQGESGHSDYSSQSHQSWQPSQDYSSFKDDGHGFADQSQGYPSVVNVNQQNYQQQSLGGDDKQQ